MKTIPYKDALTHLSEALAVFLWKPFNLPVEPKLIEQEGQEPFLRFSWTDATGVHTLDFLPELNREVWVEEGNLQIWCRDKDTINLAVTALDRVSLKTEPPPPSYPGYAQQEGEKSYLVTFDEDVHREHSVSIFGANPQEAAQRGLDIFLSAGPEDYARLGISDDNYAVGDRIVRAFDREDNKEHNFGDCDTTVGEVQSDD